MLKHKFVGRRANVVIGEYHHWMRHEELKD
jgi:hypothetical protein